MMFTTTADTTPARWINTGGDARVHRVPVGTVLLEQGDEVTYRLQKTTPLCGGIFHGPWMFVPEMREPHYRCRRCFPEEE